MSRLTFERDDKDNATKPEAKKRRTVRNAAIWTRSLRVNGNWQFIQRFHVIIRRFPPSIYESHRESYHRENTLNNRKICGTRSEEGR